tara:strand:+ start:2074 stop:3159 length:1086 start_codon:yes stop_codon:yes gene_type:complete
MDTSDPEIHFNEIGRCNHCIEISKPDPEINKARYQYLQKEFSKIVYKIKQDGKNKPYDCVIGISGGVDSSYVAYLVKELGLRPLAVHLDNGWNAELAVQNIHTILSKLDIELYTHVLDWEEFKDLQLSFLKASTPDSEIPSDHAIFAINYEIANKYGIKYFINGGNRQTESIMPRIWSQGHNDWTYIESIHKQFGSKKLSNYPHYSWHKMQWYRNISGIKWINILEYYDYKKLEVVDMLKQDLGWVPYSTKHGESIYTKFFQEYILPVKFNADKRRAHLSNLITNGELSRQEALDKLEKEKTSESEIQSDREFVIKKLGISSDIFEQIMESPPKTIYDYHNSTFSSFYQNLQTQFNKVLSF